MLVVRMHTEAIYSSIFAKKHDLSRLNVAHNTYHHFVGNGLFDSDLDIVLYSNTQGSTETLSSVLCKLDNPLINSHHDIIITECSLPPASSPPPPSLENITAPRIANTRQKTVWDDEGIAAYELAVSSELSRLQETWGPVCSSSPSSMSVLLSTTYSLFRTAAAATNKVIKLGVTRTCKRKYSSVIPKLQQQLLCAHKHLRKVSSSQSPAAVTVTVTVTVTVICTV